MPGLDPSAFSNPVHRRRHDCVRHVMTVFTVTMVVITVAMTVFAMSHEHGYGRHGYLNHDYVYHEHAHLCRVCPGYAFDRFSAEFYSLSVT